MTNNYASMTHGKGNHIVGDKLGEGNINQNVNGINPFPPRLQPLRNDEVYTREHAMFANTLI